ncbi:hypothetical protein [Microbacterium suaedae]|nr:hypothetical protein [Microbacterium suaedae]
MNTIAIPAPKPASSHRVWSAAAADLVAYLRIVALRDSAPSEHRRTWRPA